MNNISPERAVEVGRIFVIDDQGNTIIDLNTMDTIVLLPGAHVLSLGGRADRYEFCYMEEQIVFAVDALDALLIELYTQEII